MKKQFSLTRAALSTSGGAKRKFLVAASFLATLAAHAAISDITVQASTGGNFAYHSYILNEGKLLAAVNFGHGAGPFWSVQPTVIYINGVPFTGTGSPGPGYTYDSLVFGNPARANWQVTGAPNLADGMDWPGIDDVFFSEIWGGGSDKRLTYNNLDPGKSYWVQFLHGEPRVMGGRFDDTWFWTSADVPIRLPGFTLGNGIAGENPPGSSDAIVVTARITGVSNFCYSVASAQGRGPSIAGFQVREISTVTGGDREDKFDGDALADWWGIDMPDQVVAGRLVSPMVPFFALGHLWLGTGQLNCNMWNERAGAPIVYTSAPWGAYQVETSVALNSITGNQVAGLVLYNGPDGANGRCTFGLDTWDGHRRVSFQWLGDNTQTIYSPDLPLQDGSWVYLLLDVKPVVSFNLFGLDLNNCNFSLYYRLSEVDPWTELGTIQGLMTHGRVGLFVKSENKYALATFGSFKLTDGSSPPPVDPPTPVPPTPGSTETDCAVHAALADGHYDKVFIRGVEHARGGIQLVNVQVNGGRIATVGGGLLAYWGPLSDVLGDVCQITSGHEDGQGLWLTVSFRIPDLLGGKNGELQFLITPDCVLVLQGARIEIPGKVKRDAFTIEKAYIDIWPSEGRYGGGGLFGVGLEKTFGGWIDFRAGIGPIVDGHRTFDVIKLGVGAGSLAIPIGDTGAFLEYVGAIVRNNYGLSDAQNWLDSNLTGEFEVVLGRPLEIAGQEVFAYKFEGAGTWNIHDGSYDFTGEGKLLGKIKTSGVEMHYDPPYSVKAGGDFNAGAYHGRLDLHQSGGVLAGTLDGAMEIPSEVPVIGGMSFADVKATLDGSSISGHMSLPLLPGMDHFCIPGGQWTPPCFQVPYPKFCRNCWEDPVGNDWCTPPYPCGIGWQDVCPPTVHWPTICPPLCGTRVDLDFAFDVSSGFVKFGVPSVSISARTLAGGERLFANWTQLTVLEPTSLMVNTQVDPASAVTSHKRLTLIEPPPEQPTLPGPQPLWSSTRYILDKTAPAILFRTVYQAGANPGRVGMTVRMPSGLLLDSDHGALPSGYADHPGFSRFHPEAREQVIVIANPPPGEYEIMVEDGPELGPYDIQAHVNNAHPSARVISVLPVAGSRNYTVAWEDSDLEGTNSVRIYLDPDRGGHDGFMVGQVHSTNNFKQFTIQPDALRVHPGNYFVKLVIEDGDNPPVFCESDTMIEVVSTNAPAPPSRVRFWPGDASFDIDWIASPTTGVAGYRVEWTSSHEDPSRMRESAWVSMPTTERMRFACKIRGLANGVPLLVRVVAVDGQGHRSIPSPLLRLTPRSADGRHAPVFDSTPDSDATVGYNYDYLPTVEDMDCAAAYTYRLVSGPTNMTVDTNTGLVQWTPTVEQVGVACVRLQVEESTPDKGRPVFATQSFQVQVYPPENLSGIETHGYSFLSHPRHDTVEGVLYSYQPVVRGPDQNLRYQLLAGPQGMTMDPTSGLVSWVVPKGAQGAWVRLRAVAGLIHVIEQDYYLYVFGQDQLIPRLQLITPPPSTKGLVLGAIGFPDQGWIIQSSTNLVDWSDYLGVELTNGIGRIPLPAGVPVRFFRARQ